MPYTQVLLTFPDQQHAELYVNDNSANPRFSVKANPKAADILPHQPLPYSDQLFTALANNIATSVKQAFGDGTEWPQVPFDEWNNPDRHELVHTASLHWELTPAGDLHEGRFHEDFIARALHHLGASS